ncbi:MAG: hypothetical protein AAGH99_12410 [Planctomycetota bacterium]
MTTPTRPPLHLIDQASPQAHPTTLALIAQTQEPALLLGSTPLRIAAEAAGMENYRCVSVPAGSAGWGMWALRREMKQIERGRELHAWSIPCLIALQRIGRLGSAVMHLLHHPTAKQLRRLARLDRPTLRWRVFGNSLRERLIESGVAASRVGAELLPGLEYAEAKLVGDRASLRARWGVDDDTPVIALLSDPPAAASTAQIMITLNLITMSADRPLKLLVHPEQTGRERTQTLLDRYGESERFIQDAGLSTPWSVLRGCDAAVTTDHPAPLAVRYALAAGVPVTVPDLPLHREALADAPAELVSFALTAEPKRIADRLQHQALKLPTVRLRYTPSLAK